MIHRDMKHILKMTQVKLLEMKTITCEMKDTLDCINDMLKTAEEKK